VPEAKRDYYEVLGAARTAEIAEIKKAFRRLARDCHPDLNPGDRGAETRFKECAEAWEVLSDPEKRAAYDLHGFSGLRGRTMTDFRDAAFRDLYNAYFGTDGIGLPMHPFSTHQAYLREYLRERSKKAKRREVEAE
jgi:molecular chaperone DnaJ